MVRLRRRDAPAREGGALKTRRGNTDGPGESSLRTEASPDHPPQALFRRGVEPRRRWGVALACGLSALLLTVSFAPFDLWFVALCGAGALADGPGGGAWPLGGLWATAAGFLFWAGNLYWLWWITLVGYVALVIYLTSTGWWRRWCCGRPIGGTGRCGCRCRWSGRRWSSPGLTSSAGFRGSSWPTASTPARGLIQIADVTGQYGVSFFVAMVNGAIVDLLTYPLLRRGPGSVRPSGHVLGGVAASVLGGAGLIGYGSGGLGSTSGRRVL